MNSPVQRKPTTKKHSVPIYDPAKGGPTRSTGGSGSRRTTGGAGSGPRRASGTPEAPTPNRYVVSTPRGDRHELSASDYVALAPDDAMDGTVQVQDQGLQFLVTYTTAAGPRTARITKYNLARLSVGVPVFFSLKGVWQLGTTQGLLAPAVAPGMVQPGSHLPGPPVANVMVRSLQGEVRSLPGTLRVFRIMPSLLHVVSPQNVGRTRPQVKSDRGQDELVWQDGSEMRTPLTGLTLRELLSGSAFAYFDESGWAFATVLSASEVLAATSPLPPIGSVPSGSRPAGPPARVVAPAVAPAGNPVELYDEVARTVTTTDGQRVVAALAPADLDPRRPIALTGVVQRVGQATRVGVEYTPVGAATISRPVEMLAQPLSDVIGRRVLVRVHENGPDNRPDPNNPTRDARGRVVMRALLVRPVGSLQTSPVPAPVATPAQAPGRPASPAVVEFRVVNLRTRAEVSLASGAPGARLTADIDIARPIEFIAEKGDGSWELLFTGTDGQERSRVFPIALLTKILRVDGERALAFTNERSDRGHLLLIPVEATAANAAAMRNQRLANVVEDVPALRGIAPPPVAPVVAPLPPPPRATDPQLGMRLAQQGFGIRQMGEAVPARAAVDPSVYGVGGAKNASIHMQRQDLASIQPKQLVIGMPVDLDVRVPAVLERVEKGANGSRNGEALIRYQTLAGASRRGVMVTTTFDVLPPGQPFLTTMGKRTPGGEIQLEPLRRTTPAEFANAPRNGVMDRMSQALGMGSRPTQVPPAPPRAPMLPPIGSLGLPPVIRPTVVAPAPLPPIGALRSPSLPPGPPPIGSFRQETSNTIPSPPPVATMPRVPSFRAPTPPANAPAKLSDGRLAATILEPSFAAEKGAEGEPFGVRAEQMVFVAPADLDHARPARWRGVAPGGFKVAYTTVTGEPAEAVLPGVTAGEHAGAGAMVRVKPVLVVSGRSVKNARNGNERELVAVQL